MFNHSRYAQYPQFQEKLRALLQQKMQELETLTADVQGALEFLPDELGKLYDESVEALNEKYQQLINQAHQEYHVPFLGRWERAVEATGQACYHDALCDHDETCQATLLRQKHQIILTLHKTLVFPANQPETVGSYLIHNHILATTWEAVPAHTPAEQQEQEQQERSVP